MSDSTRFINTIKRTLISIVIEEVKEPEATAQDQYQCELWVTCDHPYCFKHGCRNALPRKSGEVRS